MTWSAPSALAFSILSSLPTVVITVAPTALASWIAAVPMPLPPAWTRMVWPAVSLALSNSMCSGVPKVTGAQAAASSDTPGAGIAKRALRLIALARQAVDVEAADAARR